MIEPRPTSALSALVDDFVASLRPDQMQQLAQRLSPDQERLFEELLDELGLKPLKGW